MKRGKIDEWQTIRISIKICRNSFFFAQYMLPVKLPVQAEGCIFISFATNNYVCFATDYTSAFADFRNSPGLAP
jgi:hypothetical protein